MKRPTTKIKNQQGISLVIALIFLFVSTLIGVSAMRTSILNERMTANALERERALEAAEVALLDGEEFIQGNAQGIINSIFDDINAQPRVISADAQNCTAMTGGICAPSEFVNPDAFDNWVDVPGDALSIQAFSTDNRHFELLDDIVAQNNLNENPRYIIEFMGFTHSENTEGETLCIGPSEVWQLNAWPYCSLDPAQFRVTALATAGNNNQTRVMLQTTYVVN